jgi:hypothetical protein
MKGTPAKTQDLIGVASVALASVAIASVRPIYDLEYHDGNPTLVNSGRL